MTTADIQKVLAGRGKTVGLTQLYKYFDRLGILPAQRRQRPQQYPDNSADLILQDLGFAANVTGNGNKSAVRPNASNSRVSKRNGHAADVSIPKEPRYKRVAEQIMTLKQIKSARREK